MDWGLGIADWGLGVGSSLPTFMDITGAKTACGFAIKK
jgi:hypothetical protein